jgi:chemotaxis protein CheX
MTSHSLPSVLDTAAAEPLHAALLARITQGTPLRIDGAAVERAGLACLQVLASARATAAAAGIGFALEGPSEPLRRMVALGRFDTLLEPVA